MHQINFIAKENGITLEEHINNVLTKTEVIFKENGISDEEIKNLVKVSAIVHDCGKTCSLFQNYLKENKKEETIHRHNEIGFALLNFLIDRNYGFNKKNENITLVMYTTLFHHSPFNKEITISLSEYYTIKELKEIAKFFNKLFEKYNLNNFIKFKEDINEEILEDSISLNNRIFGFIEKLTTFEAKKMLEKFEIIFKSVRYADLIGSQNYIHNNQRFNSNTTYKDFIKPSHFDNKRWEEQYKMAEDAFKSDNICIIDATMGWGKTICGLMYLLHSDKRGFWICPDNSLSKSTYYNIINALKECKLENIRVALLISGTICGNWTNEDVNLEDADIIVTNIDTCLNGIVRNSRKDVSYEVLFSNCIFDEFHEYAFMDTPILPRFISMINAKKRMSNVKTLLLSGTVINEGYIDITTTFKAGDYLSKEKKLNIQFIDLEDYKTNYLNIPNSLHINTRIVSCQDIFKKGNMDFCYHSEFDDKDLINIKHEILLRNGKNAIKEPSITSSTSVASRGEDMSFKNVFLINPTPYQLLQATGRGGDRWDFSVIANIFIVISKDKNDYAIYNDFWDKYFLPHINNIKQIIDKKDYNISVFELKEITNIFFTKNENTKISYKNIIKTNFNEGVKELVQIEFSNGKRISNELVDDTKYIKDGIDIRGKSESRFFSFQLDNQPFGVMSGPINTPFYRFGNIKDFNDLKCNENFTYIMSNIIKYFEQNRDKKVLYGIKRIKNWNKYNLFDYLINISKCSDTPFPMLCIRGYNSEIGSYKKK